MSATLRPTVLAAADRAAQTPAAADAVATRRRALRYRGALVGAVAFALVAVAMLDQAISLRGPDSLPMWLICVVGLGAAATSLLLGRVAFRAGPHSHADDEAAAHDA